MSKRPLHGFFGGRSGGSGTKNAKSSASSTTSTTTGPKPIFIVCPGAGGVLPRDGTLESQLGRLGRVVVIPKNTGYNGKVGCTAGSKGSLNANLSIMTNAISNEISDTPDTNTPIILVGQSFGCRAIVHWMSANHEVRKHPSIPTPWSDDAMPENYNQLKARIACILCFGYPLAHATQDRSAALKRLPSDVRGLFVMGTSDKQSLGDGLSQTLFEGVLNETAATTDVIWIDRGGHSPPNSSKWTSADLNTKIKTFISRSPLAGAGHTLGSSAAAGSGDVRAKRLAALSGNVDEDHDDVQKKKAKN